MSAFQEAMEKAKAENPGVTLQEFVEKLPPAPPAPELPRPSEAVMFTTACEAAILAIDIEIGTMKQRVDDLNRLAANMDRHIYPSDAVMAYGPISKEERWIYEIVENLVRNEERNIEILEKAKASVKEKCK